MCQRHRKDELHAMLACRPGGRAAQRTPNVDAPSSRRRRSASRDYIIRTRQLLRGRSLTSATELDWIAAEPVVTTDRLVTQAWRLTVNSIEGDKRSPTSGDDNQYNGDAVESQTRQLWLSHSLGGASIATFWFRALFTRPIIDDTFYLVTAIQWSVGCRC